MPRYAMIVVVDAKDAQDARESVEMLGDPLAAYSYEPLYVGEPWEVDGQEAQADGGQGA